MNALLYLPDIHKAPLAVALRSLIGEYGSAWHILSASAFVMMFLPLVTFFVFQRYFIQGITAGAVKG
jgi:alpha-glucoside transport system permease protein